MKELDKETVEKYYRTKERLEETKQKLKNIGKRIYLVIFIVGAFFIFFAYSWSDYENVSSMFMNIGTEIFGILITLMLAQYIFIDYTELTRDMKEMAYELKQIKPLIEKDDNIESQKSDD